MKINKRKEKMIKKLEEEVLNEFWKKIRNKKKVRKIKGEVDYQPNNMVVVRVWQPLKHRKVNTKVAFPLEILEEENTETETLTPRELRKVVSKII